MLGFITILLINEETPHYIRLQQYNKVNSTLKPKHLRPLPVIALSLQTCSAIEQKKPLRFSFLYSHFMLWFVFAFTFSLKPSRFHSKSSLSYLNSKHFFRYRCTLHEHRKRGGFCLSVALIFRWLTLEVIRGFLGWLLSYLHPSFRRRRPQLTFCNFILLVMNRCIFLLLEPGNPFLL